MASLHEEKKGYRLYVVVNGDRYKIWLGDISFKRASDWKSRVEDLVTALVAGERAKPSTLAWVNERSQRERRKLEQIGLLPRRRSAVLGEFLSSYIDNHPSDNRNTHRNLVSSKAALLSHFDSSRDLRSITAGDAEDWSNLLKSKYSPATVSKHIKRAKQFFLYAEKHGLVDGKPFQDLKASGEVNDDRKEFVEAQTVVRILKSIEDPELRAVIALARFGGLRTPSETLSLKWTDINFVAGEIRVFAPKKKHTGNAIRRVPLFAELRPFLENCYQLRREGQEYVIDRLRHGSCNWRGKFLQAIKQAGVGTWQRVFANLRASRETELIQMGYPAYDVTSWLGNSPEIAKRHYVMPTDDQFRKAVGASPIVELGQFLGQQPSASIGNDVPGATENIADSTPLPVVYIDCHPLLVWSIPPRGVEPLLPD